MSIWVMRMNLWSVVTGALPKLSGMVLTFTNHLK